jgi:hypothetical protein
MKFTNISKYGRPPVSYYTSQSRRSNVKSNKKKLNVPNLKDVFSGGGRSRKTPPGISTPPLSSDPPHPNSRTHFSFSPVLYPFSTPKGSKKIISNAKKKETSIISNRVIAGLQQPRNIGPEPNELLQTNTKTSQKPKKKKKTIGRKSPLGVKHNYTTFFENKPLINDVNSPHIYEEPSTNQTYIYNKTKGVINDPYYDQNPIYDDADEPSPKNSHLSTTMSQIAKNLAYYSSLSLGVNSRKPNPSLNKNEQPNLNMKKVSSQYSRPTWSDSGLSSTTLSAMKNTPIRNKGTPSNNLKESKCNKKSRFECAFTRGCEWKKQTKNCNIKKKKQKPPKSICKGKSKKKCNYPRCEWNPTKKKCHLYSTGHSENSELYDNNFPKTLISERAQNPGINHTLTAAPGTPQEQASKAKERLANGTPFVGWAPTI